MGRYASVNMSEFNQNRKKAVSDMLTRGGKVQRDAIGVYMRWMAQMAPYPIGSFDIPKNLYERKIYTLRNIKENWANGAYRKRDGKELSKGNFYKVKMWNYYRRRVSFEYTTTKAEAKRRYGKIINRGLLKWAFVGGLPNAGIAIPVVARGLAQKNRGSGLNDNSYWQQVTIGYSNLNMIIRSINKLSYAQEDSAWVSSAKRIAYAKFTEYINTMSLKLHSKQVKL